jgi:hypothetical protein
MNRALGSLTTAVVDGLKGVFIRKKASKAKKNSGKLSWFGVQLAILRSPHLFSLKEQ